MKISEFANWIMCLHVSSCSSCFFHICCPSSCKSSGLHPSLRTRSQRARFVHWPPGSDAEGCWKHWWNWNVWNNNKLIQITNYVKATGDSSSESVELAVHFFWSSNRIINRLVRGSLIFLIITFASSISALNHNCGWASAFFSFFFFEVSGHRIGSQLSPKKTRWRLHQHSSWCSLTHGSFGITRRSLGILFGTKPFQNRLMKQTPFKAIQDKTIKTVSGWRKHPSKPIQTQEISLGMFPSEHFHRIQEEVAVLLTVSLFIIIVIASWLKLTTTNNALLAPLETFWSSNCDLAVKRLGLGSFFWHVRWTVWIILEHFMLQFFQLHENRWASYGLLWCQLPS